MLCFRQETCSASLQDTVPFSNGVHNVGGNPSLDKHGGGGGGSRNSPSRFMLLKPG